MAAWGRAGTAKLTTARGIGWSRPLARRVARWTHLRRPGRLAHRWTGPLRSFSAPWSQIKARPDIVELPLLRARQRRRRQVRRLIAHRASRGRTVRHVDRWLIPPIYVRSRRARHRLFALTVWASGVRDRQRCRYRGPDARKSRVQPDAPRRAGGARQHHTRGRASPQTGGGARPSG